MAERSGQRDREAIDELPEDLVDAPGAEPGESALDSRRATSDESSAGDGGSLSGYVSLRGVLFAAVVLGIAGAIGSSLLPLVGGPLGLLTGAFLLGLVNRRYVETAAAGAGLGAVGALLGNVTLAAVTGAGVPLFALGAVTGLVLGTLGLYFGRDLRDGLTKEI